MFLSRGTIGVHNLTVAESCKLYLGSSGTTKRSGFIGTTGVYDFEGLTVAAGGEVRPTLDLVGKDNKLQIAVSSL